LTYLLYGLFFISCIALIASVLLQPGKTDAGALFTSNVSSAAFGPRGTATILSKITIVAAATFMLTALLLAMPALTGDISVLSTTSENTETSQPPISDLSTNSNANVNTELPANSAVQAPNSNTAVNASVPVNTNTAANTSNVKPANKPADKPAVSSNTTANKKANK
jgi:preprotein translocase subunit SecG